MLTISILAGGLALLLAALIWRWPSSPAANAYQGKQVLVVGGSSGLGLALALELQRRGAAVTVTSRTSKTLRALKQQHRLDGLQVDVTSDASVALIPLAYDLVLCCAGFSLPGLADDLSIAKIHACMDTNFYGTARVFLHFYRAIRPGERKRMVFVSSTLGLRSFVGYGAYSPSKASLRSFFESVRDEAALKGLDLAIYYVSTINSPGLDQEDLIKPAVTKAIEGQSRGPAASCERRAATLLDALPRRSIIVSDTVTRLFMQSTDLTSVADYFVRKLAPLFYFGFRCFCRYQLWQETAAHRRAV